MAALRAAKPNATKDINDFINFEIADFWAIRVGASIQVDAYEKS